MSSPEQWRIDKLVPGGLGYSRLPDGQSAFARGALPGERIAVDELAREKNYLLARRFRVLEASPERVAPPCPVQERCGGCDFMTLDYFAQLAHKRAMLLEALRRTGRFYALPGLRSVACPEPLAYRNRIRLQVGVTGALGFFAESTHDLVEIPECAVAKPELNQALGRLRQLLAAQAPAAVGLSQIELRSAPGTPRVALRVTPREPGVAVDPRLLAALSAEFDVALAGAGGATAQRWPLDEQLELEVPLDAFVQVNWPINQKLVRELVSGALARGAERFLDLYAGVGNFSLALLEAGLDGVSVEANSSALSAARRGAERHALGGRFVHGRVEHALGRFPASERFDLVIVDPPRAGARQIAAGLARLGARHIAFVSCDPVTLARDLRIVCDSGYVLAELALFDMFPQTRHFETLAWLERDDGEHEDGGDAAPTP